MMAQGETDERFKMCVVGLNLLVVPDSDKCGHIQDRSNVATPFHDESLAHRVARDLGQIRESRSFVGSSCPLGVRIPRLLESILFLGDQFNPHCELATQRSSEPRVNVLQCVRNVQSSKKELNRTISLRW
jgi:hypothetical protein